MNRFLLSLVTLVIASVCFAQDVIVKVDNSTILAKVLTVDAQNVSYKKWDNQNGPTYTLLVKEILQINYANGSVDKFENNKISTNSTSTAIASSAAPTITANDIERIVINSRAGRGKIIGGACVLGLVGVPSLITGVVGLVNGASVGLTTASLIIGCACTCGGIGLIKDGKDERIYANTIRSTPIVSHKIVKGDVAYTPSLNVLQDNLTQSKALGLGLSVSF